MKLGEAMYNDSALYGRGEAQVAARRLADVLVGLAMLHHREQRHAEDHGAKGYLECPDHACRNVREQLRTVGLDPAGENYDRFALRRASL